MTPGMTIRGVQRRFAGDIYELICLQCENLRLACIDLGNAILFRFVEHHQEEAFKVIRELISDKTLKISMLAGQGPVWEKIEEELINFWEEEARKGKPIEELARYDNSLLD